MGGDHRRYQGVGEQLGDLGAVEGRGIEFAVGRGQRGILRWFPCRLVRRAPPIALDILGEIGQQHEIGERPDQWECDRDIDAIQHLRHRAAPDLLAPHPERLDTHPFDQVEDLGALVIADGVTEHAPQEADVIAQGPGRVLFRLDPRSGHDFDHSARRHTVGGDIRLGRFSPIQPSSWENRR